MRRWLAGARATLGGAVLVTCAALVAAGVAGFVWGALGAGGAGAVLGALVSSWLFLTGLATGAIAFSAVLELTGARWASPLHELAGRLVGYLPVAGVGLIAVCAGIVTHPLPGNALGLGSPWFVVRELAASFALFGLAWFAARPVGGGGATSARRPGPLVGYALGYALVGSLWGFDLVLGPAPAWISTLIGPHVFVGAALSGAALVMLVAVGHDRLDPGRRRDAATMVFTLSIFWAYLFWSQLLTIWYGNLPDEVTFFLARTRAGWQVVVLATVACTFAIPFVLLLGGRGKRSRALLTVALGSQLLGVWLERQLLIVPSLAPPGTTPLDPAALLVDLGMLAWFVLAAAPALLRRPVQASVQASAQLAATPTSTSSGTSRA